MFELALRAGIPVIGVVTDDPVNFEAVLRHFSGKPVRRYLKSVDKLESVVYWTNDAEIVTPAVYSAFLKNGMTLVVQNAEGRNDLVFDAGILPTPEKMLRALLEKALGSESEWVPKILPALRGLSLKGAQELLMLTSARAGNVMPAEVRRTRSMLFGAAPGLHAEDTGYDFYEWAPELRKYADLNREYFLNPKNPKLIPRGVLLTGAPGTGKSMAAKVIAQDWGLPLYRFSVASVLDKYVGMSEKAVERVLGLVDREAPCVLLLDEVEKIFRPNVETDVIQRIMALLLWWLQTRTSQVLVVATTNDSGKLPPELTRAGRLDAEIALLGLDPLPAAEFAKKVFAAILGKGPTPEQIHRLAAVLPPVKPGETTPQARVEQAVKDEIKRAKWG